MRPLRLGAAHVVSTVKAIAVVADAGKWLSGYEVELLLQHVKLYLDTAKSANDFAYSLDSQLRSNQAHIARLIKTRSLRRYAKTIPREDI